MIQSIDDLIGFLRIFHRSLCDNPGMDSSLIPPNLPEGLTKLYLELGELIAIENGPFCTQDALVGPEDLVFDNNVVSFAYENQGNWTCQFEIGLPDPPVYSNAEANLTGIEEWLCINDSLNKFLITLCLREAVLSAPYQAHINPTRVIIEQLDIEPLWLNGKFVHLDEFKNFYQIKAGEILVLEYNPHSWVLGSYFPNSEILEKHNIELKAFPQICLR